MVCLLAYVFGDKEHGPFGVRKGVLPGSTAPGKVRNSHHTASDTRDCK